MKQIIFKKISIKNFLSVGNKPVEIEFKRGLNIVTGINLDKENSQNGVGKSTITDALYFALFGSTIRELKKEQIVNNINKKGCKVIVSFDIIDNRKSNSWVVTRSIKPTKIQLYKDGIDVTPSSIPKTTKKITDILSASAEVFQNAVIMSANTTLPFMAQKKVDKRKFIEGILQLGIFSEMLLLARQDYNDNKKNADIEQTKSNELKGVVTNYKNQQDNQQKAKQDRINVLLGREKENIENIEILKPKIKVIQRSNINKFTNNIKKLKKQITLCRTTEKKIVEAKATAKVKIHNYVKKVEEIENLSDSEKCITCKRPIKSDKKLMIAFEKQKSKLLSKQKIYGEKLQKLEKKSKDIEDLQEKCQEGVEKYTEKINHINNVDRDNKTIREKLKQLKTWNKQIKIDIENLDKDDGNFESIINETQERLNVINDNLTKIRDKLNILDTVKFIVSEEGVKSYIVKKILKILNGRLAYYLKKLDANCICTFNEYFEETIITDKGQECSYHNFSGGERRRIDLAMLFTFMDIRRLQSNVSINVSFYDEILDTSLDFKGIDLLMDILHERIEKYDEAIYLISHKKSAIKKATGEVICLEKKNGFTSISDLDKGE